MWHIASTSKPEPSVCNKLSNLQSPSTDPSTHSSQSKTAKLNRKQNIKVRNRTVASASGVWRRPCRLTTLCYYSADIEQHKTVLSVKTHPQPCKQKTTKMKHYPVSKSSLDGEPGKTSSFFQPPPWRLSHQINNRQKTHPQCMPGKSYSILVQNKWLCQRRNILCKKTQRNHVMSKYNSQLSICKTEKPQYGELASQQAPAHVLGTIHRKCSVWTSCMWWLGSNQWRQKNQTVNIAWDEITKLAYKVRKTKTKTYHSFRHHWEEVCCW